MPVGLQTSIERIWWQGGWQQWLLWPLSWVFGALSLLRRQLYRAGIKRVAKPDVPVVVIGNISVGGMGKTPLLIALVSALRARGLNPGVVSRGYGGSEDGIVRVDHDSDPAAVGDEPLLIARKTGVPVWIGRRRAEVAQALVAAEQRDGGQCDVIFSDDGLQHYALGRDVEIAVIDAARGHGNGLLLPAGPLREPVSRLAEVDFVVYNGEPPPSAGDVDHFVLQVRDAVNLIDGRRRSLANFVGAPVEAVAGIGTPQRFFDTLTRHDVTFVAHAYPDHHRFSVQDIPDGTVLMTEKDAVKCADFAHADCWAVEVEAHLSGAGLSNADMSNTGISNTGISKTGILNNLVSRLERAIRESQG